ncbi:MAG: zinc metallopeptidase [Phycisphaerae bacterium]|nr:zinc metallopeptidase [Phycisphaerae bacterium]
MLMWDPLYFLFVGPAMLLALWAQWRVKSAYHAALEVPCRSGFSGAETAHMILESAGIKGVRVEMVDGMLSDHYDSRAKVLRLSPDVYHGHSLASMGIAAHEAGHAIQDKEGYAPLVIRNGIVPLASVGSNLSILILMAGFVLNLAGLVWVGIGLFSTVVVFQLINLPVEFDASARAKRLLLGGSIVAQDEAPVVRNVLRAAAWTYVAATLTAVLTLAYYIFRATERRN